MAENACVEAKMTNKWKEEFTKSKQKQKWQK
jgi:hypothetical protein